MPEPSRSPLWDTDLAGMWNLAVTSRDMERSCPTSLLHCSTSWAQVRQRYPNLSTAAPGPQLTVILWNFRAHLSEKRSRQRHVSSPIGQQPLQRIFKITFIFKSGHRPSHYKETKPYSQIRKLTALFLLHYLRSLPYVEDGKFQPFPTNTPPRSGLALDR